MAIIQIRDVPEDAYETIRRRARKAGQSIQAYMLARTVEFAEEPTIDEVIDRIERRLSSGPPLAIDTDMLLEDIRSGRQE